MAVTSLHRNAISVASHLILATVVIGAAHGQTTSRPSIQERTIFPFGTNGLAIPQPPVQVDIPRRSFVLLTAAYEREAGPARVAYAQELGRCGQQSSEYLIEGLNDPDAEVRSECLRSLGVIRDSGAILEVRSRLADSDAAVRREAVLTAAELDDQIAITAALKDPSDFVKAAAIAQSTTPEQSDQIAESLPKLSPHLQVFGLNALGRMRSLRHVDVVISFLRGGPATRASAVHALGQMNTGEYFGLISAMMKDPFPTVRREAMLALANYAPGSQAQSLAISMLNDPDPTVREAAAIVLGIVPTNHAIEPLRLQLSDSYQPLHDAAREALAEVGSDITPIAAVMLADSNPRRREDGSFLIGACDSKISLNRHIALLDDPDWGVVAQAAKSLFRIGPPADITGPHLLGVIARGPDQWPAATAPGLVDAQASVFLLAGKLRYTPMLEAERRVIPCSQNNPGAPDKLRTAAIWAIGVTASSGSRAATDVFNACKNPSQSNVAVFESLKALANMRNAGALPLFKNWDETAGDNDCGWMAHAGYDLLTGTVTPFKLRTIIKKVELSINDLQNPSADAGDH
jgi:HEAT repeat protein